MLNFESRDAAIANPELNNTCSPPKTMGRYNMGIIMQQSNTNLG